MASLNFLNLCQIDQILQDNLFYFVQKDFIVQTGDPTGIGKGGDSIFKLLDRKLPRCFSKELHPKLKHNKIDIVAMANNEDGMHHDSI